MKAYIKIGCGLAVSVIAGLFLYAHYAARNDGICDVDTITLSGILQTEHFFQAKDCLMQSTAAKKTVVMKNAGGGGWETHLALGQLIHDYGWDVEVVDLCASSCANFLFPAGKTKYLHPEALLLFHGGPHQANVPEQVAAVRQQTADTGTYVDPHPERHEKEGQIVYDPGRAEERLKIFAFLGIEPGPTDADTLATLTAASDRFYDHLGVNIELPHYGQIGRYEALYKSYEYDGFTYSLETLRKLGITHIEVKGDGEWHPERNTLNAKIYEVEYP